MTTKSIPELEKSLAQLVENIEPLVDEKTFLQTQTQVDNFLDGIGPALDEALRTHEEATLPNSWIFDLWREKCLLNHDSLLLTSNIGMKVEWQATQTGLKRVAFFANCIAQVHQLYFDNKIEKKLEELNEYFNSNLWQTLLGAARRPNMPQDEYVFNTQENIQEQKTRHVIVLFQGRAWTITVIDENGKVATPAQIENALYPIVMMERVEPDIIFAAPSILPTDKALEIRKQMISRDDNYRLWRLIESSLFVLSLDDEHHNDDEEALHDATFSDGDGIWSYKPYTYRCHLQDDHFYVNFEQTWVDAQTINQILLLAQSIYDEQYFPRNNKLSDTLNVTPLEWTIETNTRTLIKENIVDFQRRSEVLNIKICDVFLTKDEYLLLKGKDRNAVIQLLLQYAQKITYGEVKGIYANMGLITDHDGCGDRIRSVNPMSLSLVNHMMRDQENEPLFERYLQACREKIATTQLGHGIDKHFIGLQMMAEAQGLDVPLFSDKGFNLLKNSFISTSSYGQYKMISHVAYAPKSDNGLSIDYSLQSNNLTLVITYKRSQLPYIKEFTKALQSGMKQISRLFKRRESSIS